MEKHQAGKCPVYRFRMDDGDVIIRFSTEESQDVKRKIQDILTESYGEYLQTYLPDVDAS